MMTSGTGWFEATESSSSSLQGEVGLAGSGRSMRGDPACIPRSSSSLRSSKVEDGISSWVRGSARSGGGTGSSSGLRGDSGGGDWSAVQD